jgi:hypothetical protein
MCNLLYNLNWLQSCQLSIKLYCLQEQTAVCFHIASSYCVNVALHSSSDTAPYKASIPSKKSCTILTHIIIDIYSSCDKCVSSPLAIALKSLYPETITQPTIDLRYHHLPLILTKG